jgi:TRAP-type uncharacterized transport system fused permease subunit
MALPRIFSIWFWFTVGSPRQLQGWLSQVVKVLSVALAVYVILAATVLIIDPWVLTAIFLCGTMTIAFLVVGASGNADPVHPSPIDYVLSLASFSSGVFFFFQSFELSNRIALLTELTNAQIFFGATMVFLTLEITRRATGLGLLAIVLIFVAYNLLGHKIDGVLGHS